MHLSCIKIRTISKRTETRFHLCLVTSEYNRVHTKRLLNLWYVWRKPCTYLASTLTPSPNGLKQDSPRPTSPRSSIGCVQNDFWAYGTFGVNYASILRQDQRYLQTDQNELPLEPHHQGVSLCTSQMIYEPMVRLAQTVYLSWVKISTFSEQMKTSIHLCLIAKEYHWVRPKQLPSLWYLRCKLCTYLESRLTLSPNRPKWASTWASSPRRTIGCVQNDYWDYGTFGPNHAPILHRH
jgi:hypothetical protein